MTQRTNSSPTTGGPKRSRLRRTSGLVATLGSVLVLSACDLSFTSLPLPGGADLGDDPYRVTVEFRDVLDLVEQSSVKVNDVTVGKVEEVTLNGYTAEVEIAIRGDVELPSNAIAQIRQTSLLGEKFVSLSAPAEGASTDMLGEGDLIPLDSSGRNTEVEEVLGALSLVLNGGGIGQLKTIAAELNIAFEGREGVTKSTLRRINEFMGQLDANKDDIVEALDRVDALAQSLNAQEGTLDLALDNLPGAIASIDRQRDDIVKMLRALNELSGVGTEVIRASKAATIDSLNALAPTLRGLADAGDDLPQSIQVLLTYPFVDAIVGQNAQQALNKHLGDYTNLSAQLNLDLTEPLAGLSLAPGLSLAEGLAQCAATPAAPVCDAVEGLIGGLIGGGGSPLSGIADALAGAANGATQGGGNQGSKNKDKNGGNAGVLPGLGGQDGALCTELLPILCRTAPGGTVETPTSWSGLSVTPTDGANPEIGAMLTWGLVQR